MRKKNNNALPLFLVLGLIFLASLVVVLTSPSSGNSTTGHFLEGGCIGLISLDGEIATTDSSGGLFGGSAIGSDTIIKAVKKGNENGNVKGILLEINSPGGSVVASKDIYDALKKVSKTKAAYIGEMGASGGYYSAAGTDYIIAHPDALTGSIGAIITLQNLGGLFEKLGVNYTTIKSGEKKDIGNPARNMTDEEKQILQGIIDQAFGEFKSAVVESRGLRLDQNRFDEITDGRILTGKQAYEIGLVDQLGNYDDALTYLGVKTGLGAEPQTCELVEKPNFWQLLLGSAAQNLGVGLAQGLQNVQAGNKDKSLEYR